MVAMKQFLNEVLILVLMEDTLRDTDGKLIKAVKRS